MREGEKDRVLREWEKLRRRQVPSGLGSLVSSSEKVAFREVFDITFPEAQAFRAFGEKDSG